MIIAFQTHLNLTFGVNLGLYSYTRTWSGYNLLSYELWNPLIQLYLFILWLFYNIMYWYRPVYDRTIWIWWILEYMTSDNCLRTIGILEATQPQKCFWTLSLYLINIYSSIIYSKTFIYFIKNDIIFLNVYILHNVHFIITRTGTAEWERVRLYKVNRPPRF